MALAQNQFTISTLAGTKVSGNNVITVEFYSAGPTDTIAPGEMVVLASTVNGLVTKVAKGSALTDAYFGVVLTNPLKDSYAVGERMEIAIFGTTVMMTASGVITGGSYVQYAYDTGKVATRTASNTIVGLAMENSTADGNLIRVNLAMTSVAGANTVGNTGITGATGATGPTGATA